MLFPWILLTLQEEPPVIRHPSPVMFYASVEVWRPEIGGGASIDDGDVEPTELGFRGDLDLSVDGIVPVFVVGVSESLLKPGQISLGGSLLYWGGGWTGEETQDGSEVFDGSTFANGTRVRATLEMDCLGVDATGIVRSDPKEMIPLEIKLSLGIRYVEADLRIRGGGIDESQHIAEGWVRGGVRVDVQPFPYTGAFLELGFGAESNDVLADGGVGLRVEVDGFSIDAGYRLLRVSDDDKVGASERNDLDVRLAGPYLGFRFQF